MSPLWKFWHVGPGQTTPQPGEHLTRKKIFLIFSQKVYLREIAAKIENGNGAVTRCHVRKVQKNANRNDRSIVARLVRFA